MHFHKFNNINELNYLINYIGINKDILFKLFKYIY